MSKYDIKTDEQLIQELRAGDVAIMDYIMNKYKKMVKRKAKAMYLLGGDNDDLIQEGMVGLFKAVTDFDTKQETSFYSFAELCITRQMYSAIKTSQRQKHIPLNSYVSLFEEREDDLDAQTQPPLIEVLQMGRDNSPEQLFLDKEFFTTMEQELNDCLSDLESRVLYLHLMGEDYQSIARLLDKSPKSIDNALQRIKNKVSHILKK